MNSPTTLTLLSAALTLCTTVAIAGAPIGHPVVNEADRALHAANSASALPNQGTVLEIIQAGEYTYINIDKEEGSEWIAVAKITASEGDTIRYSKGALMKNFHSKSLGRTFSEITFSGAAEIAHNKHPSMEETAAMLNISADQLELPNQGEVISIIPTSMYTYIEVSHDDTNRWLAAPTVDLKVGDKIKYADGAIMTDFYSKTLEREFSEVLFISKLEVID